ncbi:hypothetical protein RF55_25973, partial [Lasius niger]
MFRGCIRLDDKVDKYRAGFLADFGYFCRHASAPSHHHLVTFAQAYNSSAKMARPADSGFLSSYLVAGGYAAGLGDKRMEDLA